MNILGIQGLTPTHNYIKYYNAVFKNIQRVYKLYHIVYQKHIEKRK